MIASFDVAVLGSLHYDIMVEAPGRPRKGETLVGTGWGFRCGGKGGNQAIAAALHGARTAMIGRVGDDDWGRRLRGNLKEHGIDCAQVATDAGHGSGMSVAIVDDDGDYGAIIVSGCNLAIGDRDVADASSILENATILLIQNEIPEVANIAAARLVRAVGGRIVLNAAPARPLSLELEGLIDVLVVNAIEAEMMGTPAIGDLPAAVAAAKHLAARCPAVIVTAGAAGCALAERGRAPEAFPGYRVETIGTHGAGDAFGGALAARLANGDPLHEAVRFANAAAAVAVSSPPDIGPEQRDYLVYLLLSRFADA